MKVDTGQGSIPLRTLIAVWSISAIISLPGLAVSPIMGKLTTIFPHVSDLEIQMLTAIPSLLIIPFILLSGYLSLNKDKNRILLMGLLIFLVSGALCFIAPSMLWLILFSAMLGVGAGMIIPLSTGFIAELFVGERRTAQLGVSSAIANLALVMATFATGWLADYNWHLPFVVYLLPLFAVFMAPYLKKETLMRDRKMTKAPAPKATAHAVGSPKSTSQKVSKEIRIPALVSVMLLYLFAGYATVVVVFNLPFVMSEHNLYSSVTGALISILFLAIMVPGLLINRIKKTLKSYTVPGCLASMGVGLLLIATFGNLYVIGLGTILIGLGYGLIQPLVYDKAIQTADSKTTVLVLAYVMAVNYLTIVITPFTTSFLTDLFHAHSVIAPFAINAVLTFLVMVWAYLKRHSFVFSV